VPNQDGRLPVHSRQRPGLQPPALEHASEPFFTTKTRTQGLGLGLAICESLMRALGGELLLANHPEGGALLTLQLRVAAPGATCNSEDLGMTTETLIDSQPRSS
jgi:two-component system C4-dicarboxylate transport sensor histidine kinase DctB